MPKVTINIVPGRSTTIELEDGATLADALEAVGCNPAGRQVRSGGQVLESLDSPVEDGQSVVVTEQVKGN